MQMSTEKEFHMSIDNDTGINNSTDVQMYRNICAEYGLEVPKSMWKTTPKLMENSIQFSFIL